MFYQIYEIILKNNPKLLFIFIVDDYSYGFIIRKQDFHNCRQALDVL